MIYSGGLHCVLLVMLQHQPDQALQPLSWLDSTSSWLVAEALQHVASSCFDVPHSTACTGALVQAASGHLLPWAHGQYCVEPASHFPSVTMHPALSFPAQAWMVDYVPASSCHPLACLHACPQACFFNSCITFQRVLMPVSAGSLTPT